MTRIPKTTNRTTSTNFRKKNEGAGVKSDATSGVAIDTCRGRRGQDKRGAAREVGSGAGGERREGQGFTSEETESGWQ